MLPETGRRGLASAPLAPRLCHLDLEAINALNFSLQKYQGTVLLVTHDHDLIDEVATRIWHFDHGHIEDFKGPYEEYVAYAQAVAS